MVMLSEVVYSKISPAIVHVHKELELAINQIAAFVGLLEANPNPVNFPELGDTMTKLSVQAQNLNVNLSRYDLFFPNVGDIVVEFDDKIEVLADRFFKACIQTSDMRIDVTPHVEAIETQARESITSREAMEHFGKSRSTIYRWIKNGKLSAEKQGRTWAIFI